MKELARLTSVILNNTVSSFKSQFQFCIRDYSTFQNMVSHLSNEGVLSSDLDGMNNTPERQPITVTLDDSTSHTSTIKTFN